MAKNRIVAAMLVVTALVIAFLTFSVHSSSNDDTKDLKMVHIIMRHGIRTPVDTYPLDPHINETFFPVGWGQLTNPGKLELFQTGQWLRKRYGKFLGDEYSLKQYYVQSTDVDRTKATLQLVNAGLWPPNKDQKWGPLDWQPIPINSEPLDQDNLLLVRKPCAEYNLELERIFKSPEVQEKLAANKELFDYVSRQTGMPIKNFENVQDIYTTLIAEEAYNLTLPNWTKGYYPDKLREPSEYNFRLNTYNSKLIRFKGGVLLKKIINDWNSKSSIKPQERKTFLYGGHDSTIANLLAALKVFDVHVPGYGIAILLEFSQDKITHEYGVDVFFRNSTEVPPFHLQIPGCDKFCPLSKLVELTSENIPGDWKEECKSDDPNYVPPPPSGP